jgi:hypothetical protein
MELNRFQILLQELANFDSEFPVDLMLKYLSILQYTPITLFGINLNYTLSDVDLVALRAHLTDPLTVATWLGTDAASIILSAKRLDEQGLQINEVSLVRPIDNDLTNSIRMTFGADDLTVNNNFEVNLLEGRKEKIDIFSRRYKELANMNGDLIKTIEGVSV